MRELVITVPGAPRTKKNHGEIVQVRGRPRLLPSKAWRAWAVAVLPWLKAAVALQLRAVCPLAVPVNARARARPRTEVVLSWT